MDTNNYKDTFSPSYFHSRLMERTLKKLAFSSDADFKLWRNSLMRKFKELIGPIYKDNSTPEYSVLQEEKTEGYQIKKIIFPTVENEIINMAYLLIPNENRQKYPAMVCVQGHSKGGFLSVGNYFGEGGDVVIEGDRDFAIQAVQNGYVALAIEQRCFGEREESLLKQKVENRCWDATMHALLLGHTMISERVADVMRGIDLLHQLPFVDRNRIGCMGNSGGGTTTYYASCLDRRIKLAVPSCVFCTYEDSLMKIGHCMDNYIPGALKYFGMEDLAGLIAPRELIIVAGKNDPIFPLSGVKKAFKKSKEIYNRAGVPEKIKLVIGPEGHRFYAEPTWPLINKAFNLQK